LIFRSYNGLTVNKDNILRKQVGIYLNKNQPHIILTVFKKYFDGFLFLLFFEGEKFQEHVELYI